MIENDNKVTDTASDSNSGASVDDKTLPQQGVTVVASGGDSSNTPTRVNKNKRTQAPKRLTRKQQAFVDYLINNPKASGTRAVLETYGSDDKQISYSTAKSIANENLNKPYIMRTLSEHSQKAQQVLTEQLELANQRSKEDKPRAVDWSVQARQVADSILDRVHGKAKQQVDIQSVGVQLNIDLTTALDQ